jgi:L-threonylcarbamoyladenylate synthase
MTDFTEDIENCLLVLQNGGLILYPTDTIWGLGCDATNAVAVEKLMNLKGKPPRKGLIILLANERDVLKYVANPDPEVFEYLNSTEKPTTVIYEHGLGLANEVLNDNGSVAIRLVKEDFCRHLLKRFKKPVVSTSANAHGQASPQNFTEVSAVIKTGVDYVVRFRQNEAFPQRASSIVKWENGVFIRIRE